MAAPIFVKAKTGGKTKEAKNLKVAEEWTIPEHEKKDFQNRNSIKKEPKVEFLVRLPESLNKRLTVFIETKALRAQSKNACFVNGLDKFLTENEC